MFSPLLKQLPQASSEFAELFLQCYVASAAILVAVSIGAALGYPSVLMFQLKKNDSDIKLDLHSTSWIGSVHGIAGIFSIVMPTIMQWKGRKLAFIVSSISILFGWILMYFANSISNILIAECLHGFGANGLNIVGSLSLSEMVTPKFRNVFLQFYNLHQCVGLTLVGITIKTLYWRFVCIVFSVPLIIGIVVALTWPESPFWLAWKGKTDKCENNFLWLRGNNEESLKEMKELIAAQTKNRQKPENGEKTYIIKRVYSDITNKGCYKPGIHLVLLFSLVFFSGGMVILLYSIELILRTTHDENIAFIGASFNNFLVLLGALLSSVFVKHFRNKIVLLVSSFGCSISLIFASIFTYLQHVGVLSEESKLCLYCLLAHTVIGSSGMFPVAYATTAELMPIRYRGIGGCLSMICTCILHALTLKSAPYLFLYIGLYGTFLLFSCTTIILSVLVWKFVPETKNKSLQEMENFYMYGKFESNIVKSEGESEQVFMFSNSAL